MSTSVALSLLTNETYSFDDAQSWQPPTQYVYAIIRHGIGCNIVNIANQLSFAYRGIAPELRVFVSPPTDLTKAADFIRTLEEKQEVWHEMMTTPATFQRYYNPVWRSLPFRPPLLSQSKAFAQYQDQRSLDSNKQYNSALSIRIPYRRQNFNLQRPSPFGRSNSPSFQQPTSNPSAPRNYNRANQLSRTFDQPGIVR